MNENLSDTINMLRVLLCILIVFLHMGTTGMTYQEFHAPQLFKTVSSFISLASRIAVPLFFTISGYLFFISYDNTFVNYKRKIKNRAKHLLQPVFIFTSIYLILYFTAQQLSHTANLFSGQHKLVIDYNWLDFLNAYTGFFTKEGMFAGQFWFLRNLFIISLASPLLFYLFRYLQVTLLAITGVLYILHPLLHIDCYIMETIFFFSLGGWIGYKHMDLEKTYQRTYIWSWLFIPLLILAFFIPLYFRTLAILVGILWIYNICYYFVLKGKGKALVYFASGSYFCFLLHLQPLMFIKRASYKIFSPDSSLTMLLLYILIPVITICICYLLYLFLQRKCPIILSFLLGTNKQTPKA